MSYKTCLFDMDGTVLDTVADLADAVNHTLTGYGYPARSVQQVKDATGNGARELIAHSLHDGEATPDFENILAEYKAWYADHTCVETAPYPGIPALLEKLRRDGVQVAIVSNKPDKAAKILAERFFPGIPTFGETADIPRKPAPDMVYHAAKKLGASLDGTVYIGDSEVDVQTARNAGVDLVAVSWGFRGRERLKIAGAERIADTVAELYDLVK
ncbi:MAG: HAD-IA family hydrolase [Clostridiales bacterium]|nr:HAD-IA family hydrolase [Candidatus Cacconaster stercorequi]